MSDDSLQTNNKNWRSKKQKHRREDAQGVKHLDSVADLEALLLLREKGQWSVRRVRLGSDPLSDTPSR